MSLPHRSWRNVTADLTSAALFVVVVAAVVFAIPPYLCWFEIMQRPCGDAPLPSKQAALIRLSADGSKFGTSESTLIGCGYFGCPIQFAVGRNTDDEPCSSRVSKTSASQCISSMGSLN